MSNEELVFQIQQGIDPARSMEHLYLQNKGLIFLIIKRHRYACQSDYNSVPVIELDELMHEAYFGLIKAVESFDIEQGILFTTYATPWIRQAVKRFLENCGRVVRVPVHKQQQIYQYNQTTAYYLRNFNRAPSLHEYAVCLGVSEPTITHLQKYMYRDNVQSLDAIVPGTENEELTLMDTIASDLDLEREVVDRVGDKQLKDELWDIVNQVLKHDKMNEVLRYRFVDKLTLEAIGEKLNITRERVRQYESLALRRLRNNSRTRRLVIELGMWYEYVPFNVDRVKTWCKYGRYSALDKKEMQYAARMGWVEPSYIKTT